jgi:hypothetical protein
MGGLAALRLGRPAQREVGGDPEGALPFGKVDELPQGDLRGLQLKPQRTPEGKVLREGGA